MNKSSHHRNTERVLDIFELLSDTGNVGYSLTEISSALDAPKSSIFPIVRTLTNRGYLHYNQVTSKYFIGYRLYEIGTMYVSDSNIGNAIYRVMEEIVNGCGETCHFAELNAGDVLFLQKIDLLEALRIYSAVGRRLPAYSTALGKALLSEKSRREILSLYPEGMYALTPYTITDLNALYEQLAEVRRAGYATECEEATRHVRSIAIPIRKNGVIAFALGISLPVSHYSEEKDALIRTLLLDAKQKVETLLTIS